MHFQSASRPVSETTVDAAVVPVLDGAVPEAVVGALGRIGTDVRRLAARHDLAEPGSRVWVCALDGSSRLPVNKGLQRIRQCRAVAPLRATEPPDGTDHTSVAGL